MDLYTIGFTKSTAELTLNTTFSICSGFGKLYGGAVKKYGVWKKEEPKRVAKKLEKAKAKLKKLEGQSK